MGRETKAQAQERAQLLEEFNHACAGCGSPLDLEVDHVIPVSKGGPDTIENKQILCHHCNNAKNGTDGIPKFKVRKAPLFFPMTRIKRDRKAFKELLKAYRSGRK